ncbi:MAG: leucyl aminopeptidase [Candidatus Acidulodesulfobacterium sp.]
MKFELIDSIEKKISENKANEFNHIFVFGVFQGEENSFLKSGNFKQFEFIYKRLKRLDFKAKKGKSTIIESPVCSLVYGLDKKDKFNYDSLRSFISAAAKTARTNKFNEVTIVIPELSSEYYIKKGLFYSASAISEGAQLGLYEFKKYMSSDLDDKGKTKRDNDKKYPEIINIFFSGLKVSKDNVKIAEEGFDFGNKAAFATNFARDIVNEPGNVVTPEYLAKLAAEISKESGIECEIFNEKEIIKKGMNAFYGVSQGSKNPPRFIHLTYKPKNKTKNTNSKKIALIGKGITFDSGGLSLKPADFMTTMKSDKSGACTVLGVMKYIKDFDIDLEVHGIIAACENMPDGGAQRPDDIVKALNGKTIEIENTDAEGRLTLADALTFASNLGVDEIIDLATLTGACVIALGEYTSGVMGNNKDLISNILSVSQITGERMWELPFDDNMKEKLSSPIADLKNVGNRYGGAITAGMFLEEFVPDKAKWCHIDIAGPAFTKTGFNYNPKGGTGVGVRTLLYYLDQHKL